VATVDATRRVAAAPAAARAGGPPLVHRLRRALPRVASIAIMFLILLVLFGPVIMLAVFSFNDSPIISLPWAGFTTHWYSVAANDAEAREAVVHSVTVALVVTVLSVTLGTMAAWGLTRLRFRGKGAIGGLHGAVLVVPWLLVGVSGLMFFSRLGIPLSLETIGVMQLVVTFPLVVAIVSAGLIRFNRSLEEAAIDLGASHWQMLRYVVLPQLAPALAASTIFAFSWSFNNFEVSFFTGGFEQTFPVWVFSVLRHSQNLPMVNAISTVIAAVQVVLVLGAWRLMKYLSHGAKDEELADIMVGGMR
jgi:ABC-type spermidine/putrescine transport system permease subunit II